MKRSFESIKEIIEKISYKNRMFILKLDVERPYLQVQFVAEDLHTKKPELQKCRKWMLSYYMTDSEIVRTAYKAALAAEEHELQEFFTFMGQPIYRPHMDVYALYALSNANTVDKRDD